MFTILHIQANGSESLYEADEITVNPPNPEGLRSPSQSADIEGGVPGLRFRTPAGEWKNLYREHPLKAGSITPEVFIMNRDGKTVSRHYMN